METSTPTLEEDNPQNCSTNANETALVEEIQYRSEMENPLTIAPGEGQKPVPISGNKFCVELTHPDLLPTWKFGFSVEPEIPLTLNKYVNQRLLNFTQNFASDTNYIYFANAVLQREQVNSQINVAIYKITTNSVTARILSKNFKARMEKVRAQNKEYSFMTTVKDTLLLDKSFYMTFRQWWNNLVHLHFFDTTMCRFALEWIDTNHVIDK